MPEVDELEVTEPIQDEPILDEADPVEGEPDLQEPAPVERPAPLRPGGKRFEQVYAEGKQAKRDLEAEREKRIRAETLLEATLAGRQTPVASTESKEYTWPELDQMIATGQITRADAEAHREEVLTRRLRSTLKNEFTRDTTVATRTNALTAGVNEYLAVLPTLTTVTSPERQKVDREFDFLVSVQGLDANKLDEPTRKQLQLTALRAAFGSIEALTARSKPPRVDSTEGLPGGVRRRPSNNPDQALLDGLTERQVVHYKKMFATGRYPNKWKDVVEELKYDPKLPVVDHQDKNKVK